MEPTAPDPSKSNRKRSPTACEACKECKERDMIWRKILFIFVGFCLDSMEVQQFNSSTALSWHRSTLQPMRFQSCGRTDWNAVLLLKTAPRTHCQRLGLRSLGSSCEHLNSHGPAIGSLHRASTRTSQFITFYHISNLSLSDLHSCASRPTILFGVDPVTGLNTHLPAVEALVPLPKNLGGHK